MYPLDVSLKFLVYLSDCHSAYIPYLLKDTSLHSVLIHASHHNTCTPPCLHLQHCVVCTTYVFIFLVAAAILCFLGSLYVAVVSPPIVGTCGGESSPSGHTFDKSSLIQARV